MYAHALRCSQRPQTAPNLLALVLQAVVRFLSWVLGAKLDCLEEQGALFTMSYFSNSDLSLYFKMPGAS